MTILSDILARGRPVSSHQPWPRVTLDAEAWRELGPQLAEGRPTLSGLWADGDAIHAALLDELTHDLAVVTLDCENGRYPSIAAAHPPALRLERAARDLFGLTADGCPDARPWLDHGRWEEVSDAPLPYTFLPSEGEGLHQLAVGPVHAGIIEPGHFRFTINGETIVRLEARLGYTHKGVEDLMSGAGLDHAARLAGRVSGDSTVAYALAFSRAAEAALGIEAPPRAIWLRALMAELERLANHFGDIGAICNDAAFALMHAQCGVLRENVLRAAHASFGHRLMKDCIVPGGVAADLTEDGAKRLPALIAEVARQFPELIELYDNTASLQDRTVGAGILKPALARQFGCGGYVGRASGRAFDARHSLPYAPYDALTFDVPVFIAGDIDARVWVRIREVEQSLSLARQILDRLPEGPLRAAPTPFEGEAREGMAMVEGFRGDILAWLRLSGDLRIERCHLRDPSWFQWPVLESVVEGNIVADFPICNKSFNCAYSGHDL